VLTKPLGHKLKVSTVRSPRPEPVQQLIRDNMMTLDLQQDYRVPFNAADKVNLALTCILCCANRREQALGDQVGVGGRLRRYRHRVLRLLIILTAH
jgi:hypothetical protein